MEVQIKTGPKVFEHLNPSSCILAKIKKEIEEDFAINEALLFDEETSMEEEEDGVLVKQEGGVDPLEEEHGAFEMAQHGHLNSCPRSKTEASTKSLKVEECDEICDTQSLKTDVSGSLVPSFDRDLAQQLSRILPVPTVAKDLAGDSSKENLNKEEMKISGSSLKLPRGKKGPWWKPNTRRWWQRRRGRVEDLRDKIKGRWTALDSMPRRKEEVGTIGHREGGELSRTFRRISDQKFKLAGCQREGMVGKMIEKRCTRKDIDARNSEKPRSKRDFEGKGYLERRDRSRRMDDGKKAIQRSGTNKRDEKAGVDVKAAGRECRHQDFQQKRKDLRRHSSTSTMSTGSNASESKTLDTSLGLLTQHPLLPNVFILDPKAKK